MKLVKEIKSKEGEVHFRRWAIIETKYFSVYIHEIFAEDRDLHLHNHPWHIFTLILSGVYLEQLEDKKFVTRSRFSMAFRTRKVFHKIHSLFGPKVKTLALCFGARRPWGYKLEDGTVISNPDYRARKHTAGYEFINHRK